MNEIINSFGIDWKIFSAEIVNFLVVIGILYFFVFKKVFVKLEERKKIISEGIENSKLAEEKIEEAQKQSGEIISGARIEASDKINLAVATAEERKEVILKEAKEKGGEILDNAKKTGEEKKESIISKAEVEIAKMAILGAEKILSEK
jgi:F-type H+-transporting ATPase subunit b